MNSVGWSFSLQLVNDHTTIMSGSEDIEAGMRRHDPKSVMFTTECLNTSSVSKNVYSFSSFSGKS